MVKGTDLKTEESNAPVPGTSLGSSARKSRPLTRPVSPNISKPHPRPLPPVLEEEGVSPTRVEPRVPDFSKVTLSSLEVERVRAREEIMEATRSKYDPRDEFKLNTTKGARQIEEVRREIEEQRERELAFDSSFFRQPPEFEKMPAKVRVNTAAILREDSLFRKQQAKDAQLLRNYEAELRDANEYYVWQQKMREIDAKAALEQVELRRELAKQSAEEARDAMSKAKEDNRAVAVLLREQARAIKLQKQLEEEIVFLRNREIAQTVSEARDRLPKVAVEKVAQSKEEAAKKLREELEEIRRRKAEQDRIEEEAKADRTRQLKALNSVSKKPVTIFDPSEIAGEVFLDEMSYLEMKERANMERARLEALEEEKRREILIEKQKKAQSLEEKALSIQKARATRASAAITMRTKKLSEQAKIVEEKKIALERSAAAMAKELSVKREQQEQERLQLEAEKARARLLIQSAGSSKMELANSREKQLVLAADRQAKTMVKEKEKNLKKEELIRRKEALNKAAEARLLKERLHQEALSKQNEYLNRKKESMEKVKMDLLKKKAMNVIGAIQHEKTKAVVQTSNLYATKISLEDVEYGRALTKIRRTSSAK